MLDSLEALLRFYEAGRDPAALNGLGPTEIFLVRFLLDRIERPLHFQSRRLLEAGKPAIAGSVQDENSAVFLILCADIDSK